jgi:hypothetical protein
MIEEILQSRIVAEEFNGTSFSVLDRRKRKSVLCQQTLSIEGSIQKQYEWNII